MSHLPGHNAGNALRVALANVALPLAAFASAPILAQELGVAGRGSVSAATSMVLLLSAVGSLGLPEAVTYFVASRPNERVAKRAALLLGALGILGTTLSFLLAPFLSSGISDLENLIRVASLALTPTLIVGSFRGMAQGQQRWGSVNLEKYITAGLRLASLIVLAATGTLTVVSATLVLVLSPIAGGVAYIHRSRPPDSATKEYLPVKHLVGYGSRVWIGSLSGILLSRLDQAIMTPLGGVYALGLYTVAVSVADVILISNSAIRDVMFASDARERNDERLYRAGRISLLASAVTGATIMITLPWGLPLLFGREFAPAVPVAVILVAATVIGVPGSIGGVALGARGRPGLRSFALVVSVVVNIVVLIALVPQFGAVGAAWATFIGNFVAANLNLVFLKRTFGLRVLGFYAIKCSDITLLGRTFLQLTRRLGHR